ncbi:MAG: DUF3737 family protein [Candidatus Gastranaerophilaceae bacterium]
MTNIIVNKIFDEERSLYNLQDAEVVECTFAGPADGESVLKECRRIKVDRCLFSLRYPLWHVNKFVLIESSMDDKTRAPLWYSFDGEIEKCNIRGIKCLRECGNIAISGCDIESPEFGWLCNNIKIYNSSIISEYFLFGTKNVDIFNLKMNGKYSFQYMENLSIKNSELDTKDAFWHSKNITVKNSLVKGEYLGWFSEGLTLIDCHIIGTQPLCYCKNLKLINCTMEACDLSFEYSDVDAEIKGNIVSIKNPKSGTIKVDSVDNIIWEDAVMECNADIVINNKTLR